MFHPRNLPRVRVTLPASLSFPTAGDGASVLPARTVDFSPKGVGLVAATSPAPGVVVRVTIEERGAGVRRTRSWSGRVVATRPARAGFRISVEFLEPEAGPKSRLLASRSGRVAALVRVDAAWGAEEAIERAGAEAEFSAPSAAYQLFRAVAILGFLADQLVKVVAFAGAASTAGAGAIRNYGALGGVSLGVPGVHKVLAIVTIILTGVIGRIALRDRDRWGLLDAIGWGGLVAGMLGNAADRLALGYVRDVLRSGLLPGWIFNLADVLAVTGVACLLLARALGRAEAGAPLPSSRSALAVTSRP